MSQPAYLPNCGDCDRDRFVEMFLSWEDAKDMPEDQHIRFQNLQAMAKRIRWARDAAKRDKENGQ